MALLSSLFRMMLLLLAGVAALACSTKPTPPTVVPERVSVRSIDSRVLNLDVLLTVTNPNRIDLPLSGVTAHVVVGGKIDLGNLMLPEAGKLSAGKTTSLPVVVSVAWTDLGALAQLVGTSATVPYTVDGTVGLSGEWSDIRVPYHLSGSITQQQVITATLRSFPGGVPVVPSAH